MLTPRNKLFYKMSHSAAVIMLCGSILESSITRDGVVKKVAGFTYAGPQKGSYKAKVIYQFVGKGYGDWSKVVRQKGAGWSPLSCVQGGAREWFQCISSDVSPTLSDSQVFDSQDPEVSWVFAGSGKGEWEQHRDYKYVGTGAGDHEAIDVDDGDDEYECSAKGQFKVAVAFMGFLSFLLLVLMWLSGMISWMISWMDARAFGTQEQGVMEPSVNGTTADLDSVEIQQRKVAFGSQILGLAAILALLGILVAMMRSQGGQQDRSVSQEEIEDDVHAERMLKKEVMERNSRPYRHSTRLIILQCLFIVHVLASTVIPWQSSGHASCDAGLFWEDHMPFFYVLCATKVVELLLYYCDGGVAGKLGLAQFMVKFVLSFPGYADAYLDAAAIAIARSCDMPYANTLAMCMLVVYVVGVIISQWIVVARLAFMDETQVIGDLTGVCKPGGVRRVTIAPPFCNDSYFFDIYVNTSIYTPSSPLVPRFPHARVTW